MRKATVASYKAKLKAVCGSAIQKYEKPLPRKMNRSLKIDDLDLALAGSQNCLVSLFNIQLDQ